MYLGSYLSVTKKPTNCDILNILYMVGYKSALYVILNSNSTSSPGGVAT